MHLLPPSWINAIHYSQVYQSQPLTTCSTYKMPLPKQYLQNATAKLITGHRKYDELTPIFIDLHWLPLKERIQYKIMLLTFTRLHDLPNIFRNSYWSHTTPDLCLLTVHCFKFPDPTSKHMVNLHSVQSLQCYGIPFHSIYKRMYHIRQFKDKH